MDYYDGRTVLVTGGTGFLGRHLVDGLLRRGARVRVAGRTPGPLPKGAQFVKADLRDRTQALAACRGAEAVFHLAAHGWGLGANVDRQPDLLTENALLNTATLAAAHAAGADRYLYTSSSAVYPGGRTELAEDTPWDEEPHPSERAFGWAKRLGEIQARAYHEHYGMKVAIVRPSNPYGPHDTFDLQKSHVVPALILKALAGLDPFPVWGSGNAVRSFVYAEDVAEAMLLALERHAVADPLNLAAADAVSVADLSRAVLVACGRGGARLAFDTTKPEGHPRKVISAKKAEQVLGWRATTSLEDGLKRTVAWYLERQGGKRHGA